MKKMFLACVAALSLFGLSACGSPANAIDAAHNSRNSIDWAGVYSGVIPSASGSGINVEIVLNNNGTYNISYQYIDHPEDIFSESGNFNWNSAGSAIKLDVKDLPPHYQVGENMLIQLDMAGKKITGAFADNYILTKVYE